jgi:hypothetical protein
MNAIGKKKVPHTLRDSTPYCLLIQGITATEITYLHECKMTPLKNTFTKGKYIYPNLR